MCTMAIHQPEFMPWLGFFHKMNLADRYIVLDHVQFKKRYFENRNRITTPEGKVLWIGVPVRSKGRYEQAISEVKIQEDGRWARKFLERVRHSYSRTRHFQRYYPELERIVSGERHERLIDLNVALIEFFRRHFRIGTPMSFSSQMSLNGGKGSDLILEICRNTGASVYLCGKSGKDYLVESDFESAGVVIDYINYTPPVYPQLCPVHVGNLSSLDLLFNMGPEAAAVLAGSNGGTQ